MLRQAQHEAWVRCLVLSLSKEGPRSLFRQSRHEAKVRCLVLSPSKDEGPRPCFDSLGMRLRE